MSSKQQKPAPLIERADVPRIVIPADLRFRDAERYLSAKADEEEEIAPTVRDFDTLPYGGAFALGTLLDREFSATFSGAKVDVPSVSGVRSVRWGEFTIAGLGEIACAVVERRNAFPAFRVIMHAQRLKQTRVDALLESLAVEIDKRELYARSALLLQPDANGRLDMMAPPACVKVPAISPADLILSDDLAASVEAELFCPIRDAERFERLGIPTRRGVLLAGRPGTGKTLSARCAARIALDSGWSVFYLPDARALETALHVARAHSPALLVCEDIDRQLGGERTALVDRVLNALDGLDRSSRVVLVATSNDPEALPAPLLRPGRLDSCLIFDAPDAHAAERLLRLSLGKRAPESLHVAGAACAGLLPASIREVATRATMHAVAFTGADHVTEPDLLRAAKSVREQQYRLERAENVRPPLPTIGIVLAHAGGRAPERAEDRRPDMRDVDVSRPSSRGSEALVNRLASMTEN